MEKIGTDCKRQTWKISAKLLNMRKPSRNSLNLRKNIKSIKFMQWQNFQNRQSSKDL